jgi:hypothetical protein
MRGSTVVHRGCSTGAVAPYCPSNWACTHAQSVRTTAPSRKGMIALQAARADHTIDGFAGADGLSFAPHFDDQRPQPAPATRRPPNSRPASVSARRLASQLARHGMRNTTAIAMPSGGPLPLDASLAACETDIVYGAETCVRVGAGIAAAAFRGCPCPEASARCAGYGPQITVGLRAEQPPRGSVRRAGCDRKQLRGTSRLTVASMTHRPGGRLVRGAGERV